MDKFFKIAVMLTAVDKMSKVVRDAVGASESDLKRLQKASGDAFGKGAGFMASGAAVATAIAPTVVAFAQLEEAQLRLKSAMMGPGGTVSEAFPMMDKLAESLGNRLPGTTADFYDMFEVMLNSGISAKTILEGVGEAASYLAVAIKMPYAEAGKFAAKMKEATGVADADMLKFMDTIARVKNLGVEAGEMQYAFGRSAGALKLLGIQGLEASKSMSAVYASLVRAGLSGETVGTGFATIFSALLDPKKMAATNAEAAKLGVHLQFFKDGKFLGVENMIAQLDKLRGFNAQQRQSVINALTGGGQDAQMLQTLINNGISGFNEMNKKMAEQASLTDKVDKMLGGLAALWEATTGTITNLAAAFGAGLGPALKPVVQLLGDAAGWLAELLKNNPGIAKFLSIIAASTAVFLTAVGVVNLLKGAFIALRIVMLANPFMAIAAAAIVAIGWIYANWGTIKDWFAKLWAKVREPFLKFWEWLKVYFSFINPIYFFIRYWEDIKGLAGKFKEAGANIVTSIWEGIKSMANKPIEAMKGIVQKVRDMLPFSPAKVGPLRDIHRIKLVETIAEGMKPNAMVTAMHKVAGVVAGVGPTQRPAMSMAGGGGSVVVNFNYNGAGGSEGARSFIEELRRNKHELVQVVKDAMDQAARRKF